MYTESLPYPSSTTQCENRQNRICGSRSPSASFANGRRYPLACMPYPRAALSMALALDPSRDTPQASRSSSSGTTLPKWASTMPSEAAPHSVSSICSTVGTLTRCRGNVTGGPARRRAGRPATAPAASGWS